jgi:hypothetical protein
MGVIVCVWFSLCGAAKCQEGYFRTPSVQPAAVARHNRREARRAAARQPLNHLTELRRALAPAVGVVVRREAEAVAALLRGASVRRVRQQHELRRLTNHREVGYHNRMLAAGQIAANPVPARNMRVVSDREPAAPRPLIHIELCRRSLRIRAEVDVLVFHIGVYKHRPSATERVGQPRSARSKHHAVHRQRLLVIRCVHRNSFCQLVHVGSTGRLTRRLARLRKHREQYRR